MSEVWIAIGIVSIAFFLTLLALLFHKRIAGDAASDSLKNTVEIMKLLGLFVVAAVSFYFIDFQRQREEREKFDFDIFKTFADQGTTGTADHRLAVSESMRNYRLQYVEPGAKLDKLLISLDSTILKDPEIRTLLSLKENINVRDNIAQDRNPTIADSGKKIQDAPYKALIEQLFSPESLLRVRAYDEIKNQFGKDPAIVDDLIKYGRANMDNQNGVYNVVVTLRGLNTEVTNPKKAEIRSFCQEAQLIGDKTREQCKELQR